MDNDAHVAHEDENERQHGHKDGGHGEVDHNIGQPHGAAYRQMVLCEKSDVRKKDERAQNDKHDDLSSHDGLAHVGSCERKEHDDDALHGDADDGPGADDGVGGDEVLTGDTLGHVLEAGQHGLVLELPQQVHPEQQPDDEGHGVAHGAHHQVVAVRVAAHGRPQHHGHGKHVAEHAEEENGRQSDQPQPRSEQRDLLGRGLLDETKPVVGQPYLAAAVQCWWRCDI